MNRVYEQPLCQPYVKIETFSCMRLQERRLEGPKKNLLRLTEGEWSWGLGCRSFLSEFCKAGR